MCHYNCLGIIFVEFISLKSKINQKEAGFGPFLKKVQNKFLSNHGCDHF